MTIAKLQVEGKTCREIAKEAGLSKSRVIQILRTDKIRGMVDASYRIAAAHLPTITKGILTDCYSLDFNDRHKSRKLYLQFLRLTHTHDGPNTQNQFYVDQRGVLPEKHRERAQKPAKLWLLSMCGTKEIENDNY